MGDHLGQVWKLGGGPTAEAERKDLQSYAKEGLRGGMKIRGMLSLMPW